jgi:hypothetical protein
LRSLPSNLWGSLSIHLLWSWIKKIGMPHARALARVAEPGRGRGSGRGVSVVDVTCRDVTWRVESSWAGSAVRCGRMDVMCCGAVGEEWWCFNREHYWTLTMVS